MGKSGRAVHVADADREWYVEQISHSISGNGAEVDVSWSYDPHEAIWWCGVLDPTIPELEVVERVVYWSPQEQTPFVEEVTSEQSQTLALLSPDDVTLADCVQQAEALAVEANRTLAPARTATAAAKQHRSGVFLPSNAPASRKSKSKVRKIDRKTPRV